MAGFRAGQCFPPVSECVLLMSSKLTLPLVFLSLLTAIPGWTQTTGTQSVQLDNLLDRLSTSVRELNYRGLFTYEVGGVLDTYKIIHQVRDGVEFERLERLNGREREVLRSGHHPDCLSRGNTLLRGFAGRLGKRSGNKNGNKSDKNDEGAGYYHFKYAADKRIAGRQAALVHVEPADDYRYGYVLGIDKLTGLPLKILVVDRGQKVLERIQFVDLDVGIPLDDTELLPRSEGHLRASPSETCGQRDIDQQALDQQNRELADNNSSQKNVWQAGWLPPGFVSSGVFEAAGGDLMLTYTDGLASFSVFIGSSRLLFHREGKTRLGATLAYMSQRMVNSDALGITVVGEIPMPVAEKVAVNLNKR